MSHYTGGNSGWGTLVWTCPVCGEPYAEYETDEDGVPTVAIYDESETHVCDFE